MPHMLIHTSIIYCSGHNMWMEWNGIESVSQPIGLFKHIYRQYPLLLTLTHRILFLFTVIRLHENIYISFSEAAISERPKGKKKHSRPQSMCENWSYGWACVSPCITHYTDISPVDMPLRAYRLSIASRENELSANHNAYCAHSHTPHTNRCYVKAIESSIAHVFIAENPPIFMWMNNEWERSDE